MKAWTVVVDRDDKMDLLLARVWVEQNLPEGVLTSLRGAVAGARYRITARFTDLGSAALFRVAWG